MKDKCAIEKLKFWNVLIIILMFVTIFLAFYLRDDIRRAKRKRYGGAGAQYSNAGVPALQAQAVAQTTVNKAAFVPPWHSPSPAPDAITGATPKRMSFNRAILIVSPSVVGINTSGTQEQTASGIIVSPQGYILTNYHVVEGAESIVVTLVLDQMIKSYPAKLIDSEPTLDMAIVGISADGETMFPPASLGDSDRIFVGQDVVAIGNPFGLSQSASAGIISNTRRTLTAGNKAFEGLIQTDASINPGSSGGALINTKAEVIGINTAIYSPVQAFTGVGFAIPINQAKDVFGDFIQTAASPLANKSLQAAGGNINRPNVSSPMGANLRMMAKANSAAPRCWLGIDVYPIDNVVGRELGLPVDSGVLVNRVFANSPGIKAGMLRGDVIFRVNNKRVKDPKMFWSFIEGAKAGDEVSIALLRDGQRKTSVLTLELEPPNARALLSKAPQGAATGAAGTEGIEEISWLGVDVQPIEVGEAAQEFGIDPTDTGVFIGEVEGIAAIEAGLQPGDLIKKVNNQPVKDIVAFKEIIKKVDTSKGTVLDIVRQNRPFYITIKPVAKDAGAWQ